MFPDRCQRMLRSSANPGAGGPTPARENGPLPAMQRRRLPKEGSTLRLLLLTTSRHFQSLLDEVLLQYGLTATAVAVRAALEDREQPVVLVHAEHWPGEAVGLVERLLQNTPLVYVICPDAANLRIVVAILKAGAADAAADAPLALHALALKLRRVVRAPVPWHWQLSPNRFVPAESCLYQQGKRIVLTPTETRLLRQLCLVSGTVPPGRLTVGQLARELRTPGANVASRESSVCTYVGQLRQKLGDDPEQPRLLRHGRDGYWVVLEAVAE